LQFKCFGGSGYDIACAQANSAVIYNYNDSEPIAQEVNFNPSIKDQIFFVYLNRKQNSRDSIAQFDPALLTAELRLELSNMPNRFIEASNSLSDYNNAIVRHEEIISSLIGVKPVKEQLFSDFNGAIKSLGGWGGDFIMATGDAAARQYFIDKGYATIHEWNDVVLNS